MEKYVMVTFPEIQDFMEDPEPRFGNPYLIVEAPDEKTARKLYNEATNAYYFYGDVMG